MDSSINNRSTKAVAKQKSSQQLPTMNVGSLEANRTTIPKPLIPKVVEERMKGNIVAVLESPKVSKIRANELTPRRRSARLSGRIRSTDSELSEMETGKPKVCEIRLLSTIH